MQGLFSGPDRFCANAECSNGVNGYPALLIRKASEHDYEFRRRKHCNRNCADQTHSAFMRERWAENRLEMLPQFMQAQTSRSRVPAHTQRPSFRQRRREIMLAEWASGQRRPPSDIQRQMRLGIYYDGLTDDQIRYTMESQETLNIIGQNVGVEATTVRRIKKGQVKRYTHVEAKSFYNYNLNRAKGAFRNFTEDEIRNILQDPRPQDVIAKNHNTSQSTIQRIKTGEITKYRHIKAIAVIRKQGGAGHRN